MGSVTNSECANNIIGELYLHFQSFVSAFWANSLCACIYMDIIIIRIYIFSELSIFLMLNLADFQVLVILTL